MKVYLAAMMGVTVLGCVGATFAAEQPETAAPVEKKAAATQNVYVCPECHGMALQAGKCACGMELKKCE